MCERGTRCRRPPTRRPLPNDVRLLKKEAHLMGQPHLAAGKVCALLAVRDPEACQALPDEPGDDEAILCKMRGEIVSGCRSILECRPVLASSFAPL